MTKYWSIPWTIDVLADTYFACNALSDRQYLWNAIALTSIVVTELANTMNYGGGGVI